MTTRLAGNSLLGILAATLFMPQLLFGQPQPDVDDRETHCDLNVDGTCDHADVQLFGSLFQSVVVGRDNVAARADADGDGFVTLRDMRGLFPRSDFPDVIAWLDLYEQADQLFSGGRTIAEVAKEGDHLLSQGLTRFEVIDAMTRPTEQATLYAAMKRATEALTFAEQHLGPYDYEILRTAQLLAVLYGLQGMHAQAERMNQRQFDLIKHNEGRDRAMSFAERIWMWDYFEWSRVNSERHREAERLFKEIIAWENEKGRRTASPVMLLAELYSIQGKYDEAEGLFREGFELLKDGSVHPDRVAGWMEHYADVLEKRGKPNEAAQFRQRAAHLRKRGSR